MIYGYEKEQGNSDVNADLSGVQPLYLKQVTFYFDPDDLRTIADFLMFAAEQLDRKAGHPLWHRHIDEFAEDWRSRHPESDIVVHSSDVA